LHRDGIMHEQLIAMGYGKNLVPTPTPADALRLLAAGECDYAVVAMVPGMYIIREYKLTNLAPVARSIASQKYGYAVRKGNAELLARFTEGLAILKKTGQYDTIHANGWGCWSRPSRPGGRRSKPQRFWRLRWLSCWAVRCSGATRCVAR